MHVKNRSNKVGYSCFSKELNYINDSSYVERAVKEYMALKNMSIKEISYIGEQNFFVGLQSLTINKNLLIKNMKTN